MTRRIRGNAPAFRTWSALPALVLAAITFSPDALASADTFGLGDGHTGTTTLNASGSINRYTALSAPAATNDTSITLANATGYLAGDLVMIVQATGLVPSPASGDGTGGAVDISTNPVGSFELARVVSVAGVANGTLQLSAALVNNFASNVTQVIRVPEYADLRINPGVTISAPPWNGSTGGVVVFLATGTVTNNGTISVTNQGFRPGLVVNSPTVSNCTGLDEPAPGGAQKGDAIQVARFRGPPAGTLSTGYGGVSSGAGGGICHNSGGGGGGNGGSGGNGGYPWMGEPGGGLGGDVGGRGGRALIYSQFDHMTLGGGGGAGHGNDNVGASGGAGGGAIYIRAVSFLGAGMLRADGQTGPDTAFPGNDAAGGGGAGGSISLRATNSLQCGAVSAIGGTGGNTTYQCAGCPTEHGPGGGGGGGRILLQGSNIEANPGDCPTNVANGLAGTTVQGGTGPRIHYGATPSASGGAYVGSVTIASGGGFVFPVAAPVITAPANGSATNNNQPTISGTESQDGSQVVVSIDGQVVCTATVTGGLWSCPVPTALSDGAHSATAVARYQGIPSPASGPVTFTVTHLPPAPVISNPSNGSTSSNSPPVISGTSEPGSTVNTSIDGVPTCTTVADPNGNWSCPGRPVTMGPHTVTATATNGNGTSPPSSADFMQDRTHLLSYQGGGLGCSATAVSSSGSAIALVFAILPLVLIRARRRKKQSA